MDCHVSAVKEGPASVLFSTVSTNILDECADVIFNPKKTL
jgi:hypothetical protein